jgi:predicted GIY-YIG superfamily endonuclease
MAVKPIIALESHQVFQHRSGKLENQIKRKDLAQNPNMVRTYPHLFENHDAMKREDSLKGNINKNTSDLAKVQVLTVKSTGERSVVFSAAPKKSVSADRATLEAMARSLNQQNQAQNIAKPTENNGGENGKSDLDKKKKEVKKEAENK